MQLRQTNVYSKETFAQPRSRKVWNLSTALKIPNTGTTLCLRNRESTWPTAVNSQPVSTVRQYRNALKKADLKKGVLVNLLDGDVARFEILKRGEWATLLPHLGYAFYTHDTSRWCY